MITSVIQNTFPMKVKLKYVPRQSKTTFKIMQSPFITYQVNPTVSTKNDKIPLLLDNLSDSYQEIYQMTSQIKLTDDGIFLPSQNKLFFETKIARKEYRNYVSFPLINEEEMMQNINFTWHKASKIKCEDSMIQINDNCLGIEFRLKHTSSLSLSTDQRLKEKPIRELMEQGKILKDGEEIFIQFGIQPSEFDWWREGERSLQSISKRVSASETSKSKLSSPVFDSCLRIIIKGENIRRSEIIARGTVMAFKQLNGDNELIDVKIKAKKMTKWFDKYVKARKIKMHYFRFHKRMLLTRKEIRHFIKLPERSLQVDFDLGINEREELKVDKLLTQKNGILICHTVDKGKKVNIRIPTSNDDSFFSTNIFFGSPRQGKDVAMSNYVIESCLNANCGAIVPDVINEPTRGMADMLRNYLPQEKIVDVDLTSLQFPIYLGLDDIVNEVGVDLLSNDVVKILELDDKFDSKQLCRLVAKANNCNLYDMYCFLSSDVYAAKVYEQLKVDNELLALELEHKYFDKNMSSGSKSQAKKAVLTRLDDFISIDKIKYMFAQKPNNKFDLMDLMSQNKVIIIRMLKTGGLGELACRTIMHLLGIKVFWLKKIMLSRNIQSRTLFVFNEFHQFLSKGFEELLTDMMFEAPKYKLGLLMSLHNPSKISNSLWSMMQSASATIYLFKNTNYAVYKDLQEQLKPINIETAKNTERFESIVIPFVEGKQLQPIFVKMMKPPFMRMKKEENSKDYQIEYGTDVNEIYTYILDRETSMYKVA